MTSIRLRESLTKRAAGNHRACPVHSGVERSRSASSTRRCACTRRSASTTCISTCCTTRAAQAHPLQEGHGLAAARDPRRPDRQGLRGLRRRVRHADRRGDRRRARRGRQGDRDPRLRAARGDRPDRVRAHLLPRPRRGGRARLLAARARARVVGPRRGSRASCSTTATSSPACASRTARSCSSACTSPTRSATPTASSRQEARRRQARAQARSRPDRAMKGSFDHSAYHDRYRDRLMAIIDKKRKGETITAPEVQERSAPDDLMAALEASLGEAVDGARVRSPRAARRLRRRPSDRRRHIAAACREARAGGERVVRDPRDRALAAPLSPLTCSRVTAPRAHRRRPCGTRAS